MKENKKTVHFGGRAYPAASSGIRVKFELPSDEASKLTKGSQVSFVGKISDFGRSMGQYSVLKLSHVQIIKPEPEQSTEVKTEKRFSADELEDQPAVTDSEVGALYRVKGADTGFLLYSPELDTMVNPDCPTESMEGTIRNQIGFDCIGFDQ